MNIELKSDARYALLVPTSMGIRLTPASGQPFHRGGLFAMQATSAETNVASVAAYLGLPVKVLTAFVAGSPVARYIREDLQGRGMDVEAVEVEQGGPWGYRHQINMADTGFGPRGPRVWNDRAGEVGRCLSASDFDLERIFGVEGVRLMHLSGLVAALAPEACLALAEAAHAHGTCISFDLNYRASFWKGQQERLREVFSRIAASADILIGNEEDFQLSLGVEGPEAGGRDLSVRIDAFRAMIARVRAAYPRARVVATTLREVLNAGRHLWGAVVSEGGKDGVEEGVVAKPVATLGHVRGRTTTESAIGAVANAEAVLQQQPSATESVRGDKWFVIPPREIRVLDRIGGGDGFVGGLLYGILKGWDGEKCAQFGWASGAMAATLPTDYATPADEEQIWSIWNGNARVKR